MSGVSAIVPGDRGLIGKLTALVASCAGLLRAWHELDPTGAITMEFIADIPTWAVIVIAIVAVLGAFAFAYVRYTASYKTVKKHAVKEGAEVPEFGKDYKIAMILDTLVGGLFAIGIGVVIDIVLINLMLANFNVPMVIPIIFGIMLAFVAGVVIAFILDAYVIHDYFNGKADEKITALEEETKKAIAEQVASEENQKKALAAVQEQAVKYGIVDEAVIAKINDLMQTEGLSFVQAYNFLSQNGLI